MTWRRELVYRGPLVRFHSVGEHLVKLPLPLGMTLCLRLSMVSMPGKTEPDWETALLEVLLLSQKLPAPRPPWWRRWVEWVARWWWRTVS